MPWGQNHISTYLLGKPLNYGLLPTLVLKKNNWSCKMKPQTYYFEDKNCLPCIQ